MYAVFIIEKKFTKGALACSEPRLEPLDFGIGDEPQPYILLRRGRVALFETKAAAESAHRIELVKGRAAWTFVLAGPRIREWGFLTESGWVRHQDYFAANFEAAQME